MSLLAVKDLHVTYHTRRGPFKAVDGVSFDVAPGETVGLVGESGCGKSTLGKAIIRLVRPSAGSIKVLETEFASASEGRLRPHRHQLQMVFQDPFGSLNPRQTIQQLLEIPLKVQGVRGKEERRRRITAIIEQVGLPQQALKRYPHEFSGGQRQRIGIARALILCPKLVICDEPVSALDLSIQAQILNLLVDLKKEFGLSYVFISHDLSVVRYIADRVLVMYLGRIVESAPYTELFKSPKHPYTRALLAAVPSLHPEKRTAAVIRGEISRDVPTRGCRFRTRCSQARDKCSVDDPPLLPTSEHHLVACHFAE